MWTCPQKLRDRWNKSISGKALDIIWKDWLKLEITNGSDLHCSRSGPATSTGAGLNQKPPWKKAQAMKFCRTRPEPEIPARAGPKQRSLWEQAEITSRIAEWPWGVPSNHWECWLTFRVSPPWGKTIWALDPLALRRVITRDTAPTTPTKGKNG